MELKTEEHHFDSCNGLQIFLFFSNMQIGSWVHTASCSIGTTALSLEIKQPKHEADHSPPSSVEVKNEWNYASAPPICLYGTVRDNFGANYYIWLGYYL